VRLYHKIRKILSCPHMCSLPIEPKPCAVALRFRITKSEGGTYNSKFIHDSELVGGAPQILVAPLRRAFRRSSNPPSDSQQCTEQTRRKIKPRVFEEICHCKHRAVEGFHEKYFKGRKWSRRTEPIWQEAKKYYDDNGKRWRDLEGGANEDKVYTWWLSLSENLRRASRW
jgi:hypothetical protein